MTSEKFHPKILVPDYPESAFQLPNIQILKYVIRIYASSVVVMCDEKE